MPGLCGRSDPVLTEPNLDVDPEQLYVFPVGDEYLVSPPSTAEPTSTNSAVLLQRKLSPRGNPPAGTRIEERNYVVGT